MPQENPGRKVKTHEQMIKALELRAGGASFARSGKRLGVSKPRAFKIVRVALDELVQHCRKPRSGLGAGTSSPRPLRLSLDARKGDPRTVEMLIRISASGCKTSRSGFTTTN